MSRRRGAAGAAAVDRNLMRAFVGPIEFAGRGGAALAVGMHRGAPGGVALRLDKASGRGVVLVLTERSDVTALAKAIESVADVGELGSGLAGAGVRFSWDGTDRARDAQGFGGEASVSLRGDRVRVRFRVPEAGRSYRVSLSLGQARAVALLLGALDAMLLLTRDIAPSESAPLPALDGADDAGEILHSAGELLDAVGEVPHGDASVAIAEADGALRAGSGGGGVAGSTAGAHDLPLQGSGPRVSVAPDGPAGSGEATPGSGGRTVGGPPDTAAGPSAAAVSGAGGVSRDSEAIWLDGPRSARAAAAAGYHLHFEMPARAAGAPRVAPDETAAESSGK